MDLQERRKKVAEYEAFVEQRLVVDLEKASNEREKLLQQIQDYTSLADSVRLLQTDTHQLHTMVNLGSDILAQARVPDATRIFVDIGLGFHAELTWDEAIAFCQKKEIELNRKLDDDNRRIAGIKSNINLVLEGIRELSQL
ncbi:prefoldin alpha subunit [Klebsormidium nitens]|uniref:Prefoldin alpha subunit n=1 Tax=Klebsormidium nitens TaxID=105231 RepID=A0A1Y1HGY6_KLENI|nr:prefoldin alpha subunit [Klebsormidium nitens]|eukprot:GAQ77684.1 prefoldin alpha subunit [Klebsormidium nitens]